MVPIVRQTGRAEPRFRRLCGSVHLLSWDVERPVAALAPHLTRPGGAAVAPCSAIRLALADGTTRVLMAFRHVSRDAADLQVRPSALAPAVELRLEPDLVEGLSTETGELAGLTPEGRRVFADALANTWPSLFRLKRNPAYAQSACHLIGALGGTSTPARPLGSLPDGAVLVQAPVPAGVTRVESVQVLSNGGVASAGGSACLVTPGRDRRGGLVHLLVEPGDDGEVLLVLRTPEGLLVRPLPRPGRNVPIGTWWTTRGSRHARLRDWLIDTISRRSASGRALAHELQMAAPIPASALRDTQGLPRIGIDVAVSTEAGLVVSGWRHDPAGQLDAVMWLRPDGTRVPLAPSLHAYPGQIACGPGKAPLAGQGFVALLPGGGAGAGLLQPRFVARLASGTEVPLVPEPQPSDPVERRARVLAAVPPQHVTAAMLDAILGPALAALGAEIRAGARPPTCVTFGTPPVRPRVSIVVPLYRVLEFLRAQVAAFATDPELAAGAEILFVLDSPEQAAEVEHLLRGLHLVYGLPMRLVVMARNAGFSAACNAGAAAARGAVLAFVNSDVVPAAPGWLGPMTAVFEARGRVGAVGPKLLFADGSLQHAGLFFKRDSRGQWLNHHYYKGFPRHYGPADRARSVPGVTGACVLIPGPVFEEVGGFTEDYVIGDYEDSDLCLKIRARGYDIRYEPAATLYHLERQSIRHSPDYTKGVASQHNAWMQTRRWDAEIAALATRFEASPAAAGASIAAAARSAVPAVAAFRPGIGRRRAPEAGAPGREADPVLARTASFAQLQAKIEHSLLARRTTREALS